MDIQALHALYEEQSKWFRHLCTRFFQMASIHSASCVLEVGAGTSLLTEELEEKCSGLVVSADICRKALEWKSGKNILGLSRKMLADGHHLPFKDRLFDSAVCQMLLLWVKDPFSFLDETFRVLKVGGYAVFCAEPDYGGTIEYPASASIMGLIAGNLQKEGADPTVGRRLLSFFPRKKWGIVDIQVHPSAQEWQHSGTEYMKMQIFRVRHHLEGKVEDRVLERWEAEFTKEIEGGNYFSFVPHFGLVARKKH